MIAGLRIVARPCARARAGQRRLVARSVAWIYGICDACEVEFAEDSAHRYGRRGCKADQEGKQFRIEEGKVRYG